MSNPVATVDDMRRLARELGVEHLLHSEEHMAARRAALVRARNRAAEAADLIDDVIFNKAGS